MTDIKNLNQLFEVFKPSDNIINKDSRFIKPQDHIGWTDGYIADLTDIYAPTMELKAKVKRINIVEGENAPKIQPILELSMGKQDHEVEKVEFDLASQSVELSNTTLKSYCKPEYLQYFQKAYADCGGIQKITITGALEPIKLYGYDNLFIGVIMPIRHEQAV